MKQFFLAITILAGFTLSACAQGGSDLIDIDASKLISNYNIIIKAPSNVKASADKNSIIVTNQIQFQVSVSKTGQVKPEEDKKLVTQSKTEAFQQFIQEDGSGFIYSCKVGDKTVYHFRCYTSFKGGKYIFEDKVTNAVSLDDIKLMYALAQMTEEKQGL